MARQNTAQGFNKEKLTFLVAAAVISSGVYFFLLTSPVLLVVGQPFSSDSVPVKEPDKNPDPPQHEDYYVVDGKITGDKDVRTGRLVNRERKTPFNPAGDFILAPSERAKLKEKSGDEAGNKPLALPPPPPPPKADEKKETTEGKKKKEFGPQDVSSEVEYVGVFTIGNLTYAMLRLKDTSTLVRKKVGDVIPGCNYTVTSIEKQAIEVVDDNNNTFLLRNQRYTDAGATPDSSSDDDKADAKDDGKKKADGKTPPPAPQPAVAAPPDKKALSTKQLDHKLEQLEKLKAKMQAH